jgi:hypothetical protein
MAAMISSAGSLSKSKDLIERQLSRRISSIVPVYPSRIIFAREYAVEKFDCRSEVLCFRIVGVEIVHFLPALLEGERGVRLDSHQTFYPLTTLTSFPFVKPDTICDPNVRTGNRFQDRTGLLLGFPCSSAAGIQIQSIM